MKILFFVTLFPMLTFAQKEFDPKRYTQFWVIDNDSSRPKLRIEENNSISNQSPFPISNISTLALYIPDSNRLVFKNRNKFILCYLINFSSDTLSIDRCDATIYPSETQIFVNAKWKTFQIGMGSSCGNSYFSSKIFPKSFYTLEITRPSEGNIQTKFRAKIKVGNKEYFSNPTIILLSKEEIEKAGNTINPF
jgi:hypothetical protein